MIIINKDSILTLSRAVAPPHLPSLNMADLLQR